MHRLSALAVTLAASALGSGCAFFPRDIAPPTPIFTDERLAPSQAKASIPADAATMNVSMEGDLVQAWLRLSANDEPALAQAFLLKGISLVDARCDQYFHSLGLAAQKMAFANKELNLTTGLVAALQGLTGVASRDIALTGSSLAFLGASSTAYGDVFIFSPEVSSVQALVAGAQGAVKGQIGQMEPGEFSKAVAISHLREYEKTCEVHTIRRLVNESLVSARPIASYATEEALTLIQQQRSTRQALARLLGIVAVTDDQFAALYGFSWKRNQTSDELAILARVLKDLSAVVDSAGKFKTGPEAERLRDDVMNAFAPLVAIARQQLDAMLAAVKQEGAAAPAVARAAPGPPLPAPRGADPRTPTRPMFAQPLTVRVLPSK